MHICCTRYSNRKDVYLMLKAQLTRTACKRLFSIFSDSSIDLCCRGSQLQVAGSWLHAQVDGNLQPTRASRERQTSISVENEVWRRSIVVTVQLQLSTRNCSVPFSSCVSWHRLLNSVFLRMIPASIDGRCWFRLHFAFVWVAYCNSV